MKYLSLLTFLALSSCASAPAATPAPTENQDDYAWVELVPASEAPSQQMARVITHQATCPELQATLVAGLGKARHATLQMRAPMRLRAGTSPKFDVISCELPIPPAARSVRVLGQALPVLANQALAQPLNRIAVFGDTGCRLKGGAVQACNDPNAWPFDKVMKAAAAWKPDLMIHVGDYYYRETACPAENPGCAGSPFGEKWETWREDFFAPASAAFRAAPWLLIRGNHENCERAGDGWARFLEAKPYSASCNDGMPPYALELGDHRIWVIDSAQQKNIEESLKEIHGQSLPPKPAWLITHRPFLADKDLMASGKAGKVKEPLPMITNNELPPGLELVLNGHFHEFRINRFKDGKPPQIVTGNGGTQLDIPSKGLDPNDKALHDLQGVIARWDFGFLGIERSGPHRWKITEHDVDGKEVYACTLKERAHKPSSLKCDPRVN
jgi:hypothetical protein